MILVERLSLPLTLFVGNGTQSIIWQINEETYRQTLEPDEVKSAKVGPKVYYGSIHDILSYPCEVQTSILSGLSLIAFAGWEASTSSGSVHLGSWCSWPIHREYPPSGIQISRRLLGQSLPQTILADSSTSCRVPRFNWWSWGRCSVLYKVI